MVCFTVCVPGLYGMFAYVRPRLRMCDLYCFHDVYHRHRRQARKTGATSTMLPAPPAHTVQDISRPYWTDKPTTPPPTTTSILNPTRWSSLERRTNKMTFNGILRTLTQLIKISLIMAATWFSCLDTVSGCQVWLLYPFFGRFSVSNRNYLIRILRPVWPTLVVPISSFMGWWKWSGTIMNRAFLTHMCTKGVNRGQLRILYTHIVKRRRAATPAWSNTNWARLTLIMYMKWYVGGIHTMSMTKPRTAEVYTYARKV